MPGETMIDSIIDKNFLSNPLITNKEKREEIYKNVGEIKNLTTEQVETARDLLDKLETKDPNENEKAMLYYQRAGQNTFSA